MALATGSCPSGSTSAAVPAGRLFYDLWGRKGPTWATPFHPLKKKEEKKKKKGSIRTSTECSVLKLHLASWREGGR